MSRHIVQRLLHIMETGLDVWVHLSKDGSPSQVRYLRCHLLFAFDFYEGGGQD